MNCVFILLVMLFCHVIADFNLQGWLASAKQKEYWEINAPGELYQLDYIGALLIHSFAWTFLIMLPLVVWFDVSWLWFIFFAINVIIHAVVDHLKANSRKINLIVDQSMHFIQILTTLWIISEVQVS